MIDMRKYIVAILLMLEFIPAKSQYWFDEPIINLDSAQIQVMYQLTYVDDTNHVNFKKQEKQILITGYEASCYQSYNHHKLHSIGRQKQLEGNLMEWMQGGLSAAEFSCEFSYIIYKKHRGDTIITTDRVFTIGSFRYEEDKSCFNWEITQDTATIHGYVTQKAVCDFGGRCWEAWFTAEIPISDGPYKFCGLPGLILKIEDTKGHYVFEMTSVEAVEKGAMVEYLDREDYIMTTKKKFFKVLDDSNKNLVNKVREAGGDASTAHRVNEYEISKNNPLELDRK